MLTFNPQLTEAHYDTDNISTGAEDQFKKDLDWLLAKQGYNRYRARLKAFVVRLLFPGDPEYNAITTAAISFDDMTIYVNIGMLDLAYYKKHGNFREFGDVNKGQYNFSQMSMLIRHELSHNLLMHQIRMVKKLADKFPELKLRTSSSLHNLLNILEDFEISNKRYTDEDKLLVRNTYLNGQFISGLITEDSRANWADLSLEEMYDKIKEEIDKIYVPGTKANKMNQADQPFGALEDDGNWWGEPDYNKILTNASLKIHSYKNPSEEASVYDLDELLKNIKYIKSVNPDLGNSFEKIVNNLKTAIIDDQKTGYSDKDIDNLIKDVQKSKFDETVVLKNPSTGEVICDDIVTPEEKVIAIEALNVILGKTPYNSDYAKWKKQIELHVDPNEFTAEEIQELIDTLEKSGHLSKKE